MSAGYDKLPEPPPKEPGVLRALITSAHKKGSSEAILWNRKRKIAEPPTEGLWSLYLDGSFSVRKPVTQLVEGWLAQHEMALFKHPWRDCAYDEIDECVKRGKLDPRLADKARAHLSLAGHPRHWGLWACGIIARRTQSVIQGPLAATWLPLVQECPRDQIWLPLVIRTLGIRHRILTIDKSIYKTHHFKFRGHNK